MNGQMLQVEILDTAGQDVYSSRRETFMHTGDAFMLVYSITDDQTLEDLNEIHAQIMRAHPDKSVPILIVGNKLDMAAKSRSVTIAEGRQVAANWSAEFIEVSAKDDTNVTGAFDQILRKVVSRGSKESNAGGNGTNVFGGGSLDHSDDAYDYDKHASDVGVKKGKTRTNLFAFCNIL